MENARDTFYLSLRNALAVVNPLRLTVIRGVQRPGILVEDNESTVAVAASDVFVLRWTGLSVDVNHALPLVKQDCEISYWSEGTSTNGGLDRGRLLAAMDAEVTQILLPDNAAKQSYSVTPPVQMASRIFWSAPDFASLVTLKNRLSRVAKVAVFSYEEAAEA
jgi:hypothetical protein